MGKSWTARKRLLKPILYQQQRGCCKYCGNKFPMEFLTFDHVVRRKDGGKDNQENLVLACKPCNQYREMGDSSPEAIQEFIKAQTHYIHMMHKRGYIYDR